MSASAGMDRGPSAGGAGLPRPPAQAKPTLPLPAVPLPAVSGTAISVAGVRAWESARGDALFSDPFAELFASRLAPLREPALDGRAAPPDEAAARRARGRALHVIIRTRFYDEFLLDSAADGIRQVVLIGAGLDARAYRLDWPEPTVVFEVDLPGVLAAKQSVLDQAGAVPRADRRVVAADLSEPIADPLRASGFDPGSPTAWLAEGVLVYLEPEIVRRLLGQVTELSAPGSRLAAESGARLPAADEARGAETLWRSGRADGADALLPDLGWTVRTHRLGDLAAGYGRPIGVETVSSFATATRG
jgi:methyltransferase (TIGR00027 family)